MLTLSGKCIHLQVNLNRLVYDITMFTLNIQRDSLEQTVLTKIKLFPMSSLIWVTLFAILSHFKYNSPSSQVDLIKFYDKNNIWWGIEASEYLRKIQYNILISYMQCFVVEWHCILIFNILFGIRP